MFGIDVSEWQGAIDWPTVKGAGVDFAVIRVADGLDHPDPRFAENWAAAAAAGVKRAGYLYFRAGQDVIDQADLLARRAGGGELAPWLDCETTDGFPAGVAVADFEAALAEIQIRLGHYPTLYTGPAFWRGLPGGADSWFVRYPLAIAHYGVPAPAVPAPWTSWTYWQHTSAGRVPGIGGLVDLDLSVVGLITQAPFDPQEHPFMHLNAPVVAIVRDPAGGGYWEVAADGGVFAFGGALGFGGPGSPPNPYPSQRLNAPVVDADATPTGQGLYLGCADGGVLTLGDAAFAGSVPGLPQP